MHDSKADLFNSQLDLLKEKEAALKERKLIIYQIKGDKYRVGVSSEEEWRKIVHQDLHKIKQKDSRFEVILIGLDGGIKLRQNSIILEEDLFALIDGMPMRIRELKNKKN